MPNISVGDALREISRMNLIQSDFILMNSDTLANFNLAKALEFHLKNKENKKCNIITKIYRYHFLPKMISLNF